MRLCDIRAAAKACRYRGPARSVFLAMLHYVGDDAVVWPSQAELAELTGLAERTVRYALATLEGRGKEALGAEIARVGTRRGSTAYRILAAEPGSLQDGLPLGDPAGDAGFRDQIRQEMPDSEIADPAGDAGFKTPIRQEVPVNPAGGAAEGKGRDIREREESLSYARETERDEPTLPLGIPPDPDPPRQLHDDATAQGKTAKTRAVGRKAADASQARRAAGRCLEVYAEIAARSGFAGIRQVSDKRVAGMIKVLKDITEDDWRKLLEFCAEDHFYSGRKTGWQLNVDFLLRSGKAVELLEKAENAEVRRGCVDQPGGENRFIGDRGAGGFSDEGSRAAALESAIYDPRNDSLAGAVMRRRLRDGLGSDGNGGRQSAEILPLRNAAGHSRTS